MVEHKEPLPQRFYFSKARFSFGLLYFIFLSGLLTAITGQPFWVVFFIWSATATTIFFIGLVLAARRVAKPTRGRMQFQLSTIFLIIAILSIYLSFMRWITLSMIQNSPSFNVVTMIVILIPYFIFSIPFVLFFGEGILWLAVQLVRNPFCRRLLLLNQAAKPEQNGGNR